MFASMALYDAREKRKVNHLKVIFYILLFAHQVSENFYFDMNNDAVKRMLGSHLGPADISTQVLITNALTPCILSAFNSYNCFRPVHVFLM